MSTTTTTTTTILADREVGREGAERLAYILGRREDALASASDVDAAQLVDAACARGLAGAQSELDRLDTMAAECGPGEALLEDREIARREIADILEGEAVRWALGMDAVLAAGVWGAAEFRHLAEAVNHRFIRDITIGAADLAASQ